MATQDLRSLRSAINSAKAAWKAEDNPLASLGAEERKSRLGLDVDPADLAATANAIASANSAAMLQTRLAAPASVDWRNNGGNFVTPIKDQASCGSCVSFATCATFEARLNIVCKSPGNDRDLAEAELFYCGCGNCCPSGWNFPPALDYCRDTGVSPESAFPYTPGNQPCKSGLGPRTKITSWTSLLAMAERKDVLARKGPVVAGMAVYADFYNYDSGVYSHVSGELVGYHAVCVVGYDDGDKCWIAKNSWGQSWGESGFFRIAYGQCDIDTSFAFYDMELTCPRPGPTTTCERYVPYLRSVLAAARQNRALRRCLLYYVCGQIGHTPRCSKAIRRVIRRVLAILTECPEYRASFCRALIVR